MNAHSMTVVSMNQGPMYAHRTLDSEWFIDFEV